MPAPHVLSASPETVHWGYFDAKLAPRLTVNSGDTVTLHCVSGGPVEIGVRNDLLPEHKAILAQLQPHLGPHILTGPVAVRGAEPGDTLEVRIKSVDLRVDWSYNGIKPLKGTLPEDFPLLRILQIPLDRANMTATLPFGPTIPLRPFMGIMAVAPPPDIQSVSSRPPGAFGGNLDLKQLTRGSTIYLPVYNPGALFFTGDAHAAQGDGEVDGTAIETSLTPVFQFFVHKAKGKNLKWPRAETPTHYISMGIDKDLNLALKSAVQETVDFLMQEKGLDAKTAYAIASIAVDFRVAEAVNLNQMVYGMIPKNLFVKERATYWQKP